MSRPELEVADVFRASWESYTRKTSATLKVARDIMVCRTSALGGHLYRCQGCSHIEQSYNSCRNRHCPKCQGKETADWVENRRADLVPVPYFHVVFTLPEALNELVLLNRRLLYEFLFRAVRETLLMLGRNNLGVELGFFSVLHTWGQLMQFHPHVHCVIPACGLMPNGKVKVFTDRYLLSDRALSAVFRGKFISFVKRSYDKLRLPDSIPDRDSFERLLSESCTNDWVVYSKAPFAGPGVVVKYLARYTHRVAIGNSRLVSLDNGRVSFRYRDYKDDGVEKMVSLEAEEFIRRFLLHVVPKGFVRIRHCGFLCHSKKRVSLVRIRSAILCGLKAPEPRLNPHSAPKCPCCGGTSWILVGTVPRMADPPPLIPRNPLLSCFH